MNFTNLHLHTEFSLLDGMTQVWNTAAKEPGEIIHRLKAIGQTACAVTDHGTTSGWVRFDKACHKNGIKPIFGVEGYFCPSRFQKGLTEEQKLLATRGMTVKKDIKEATFRMEKELGLSKRAHFCAWAMNKKGIYEILWSMSKANIEGFYHRPRWDWELIKNMKNCLFGSACMGGILNWKIIQVFEGKLPSSLLPDVYKEALVEARRWRDELGDRFYIEIMGVDLIQQPKINYLMYKIATELSIPIIATQDPHYVKAEDWETHDILLAMNSTRYDKLTDALTNPNRMRYEAHDLYIKSADEMYKDLVARNPKIPEPVLRGSIERTMEIVGRCEGELIKKSMIMPKLDFPNPKGLPYKEAMKDRLSTLVKEGWGRKVAPYISEVKQPLYLERIKEELHLIVTMGFSPYFILCNDLMKWVDSVGIERGPARGSSCGSLVAYLLDITMIDPIPHNLLFSRFIDPNRSDFPDVDMDFQDDRRREVVEYFIKKYGRNNVAVLGNNSQFKAKMVLKDVARLYNVPLSETQAVCNLVLERSGADSRMSFCLADTLAQQDEAKLYDRKYPEVFKYACALESRMRGVGVHAAGVIIGDGDIRKYTALRADKKDKELWVSLIDKHDAEDIGLLKMDVLGLNTMAVINETKNLIKERHKGKVIESEDLIRDVTYNGGDKAVYKEFSNGNTAGIFQFNTPALKRLSMQVKIDKFSELSDACALCRPGPIHSGAAANYPAYKFKLAKVEEAEHEIIAKWTKPTYGLIIYQEQVMQIVRELGDFNWAQTNTVRKVMSKSGGAEYFMTHFWPQWKIGCNAKGMDDVIAEKAFKRIMSFGSWAFNLSISKGSKILNTSPNKFAPREISIEDLYKNEGYATDKWRSQPKCYKKMNTLSKDSDGKLRPARIKNVFYHGKQRVWEIKVESGKVLEITAQHRLAGLEDGEETFLYGREIKVGCFIEINSGYEKTKLAGEGKGWAKNWAGHKHPVSQKPYKDGRTIEKEAFRKKMLGLAAPCQRCGREYDPFDRFEAHHITYEAPNSKMRWLCNSCHKIEQYEMGRVKVWGKGFSTHYEEVVSKKYMGWKDTYDIEMEDESRPTFVANGFVSHNSHSCAYAFVSYISMWLKVHYPAEFCTAYLNKVTGGENREKNLKGMIKEVERLGLTIREADINISKDRFVINPKGQIVAGLSDIKNVGAGAVATIVQNQPYTDLVDFMSKIDNRACNKRAVENLIKSGAFNCFNYDKKVLLEKLEEIQLLCKKKSAKAKAKALEILKECKGKSTFTSQEEAEIKAKASPINLGKHLSEFYPDVLAKLGKHIKITKLIDIELDEGAQQSTEIKRTDVWVLGVITSVDLKRLSQEVKDVIDTTHEQRYALCNLEDDTDFIVLSFKGTMYNESEQKLFGWKDRVMLIHGTVNIGWKKIYVNKVIDMEGLRAYIKNDHTPYNFNMEYLFQHPLHFYFNRVGGVGVIRKKYDCKPLIELKKLKAWKSLWALGVITEIRSFKLKRGEMAGQDFFWVIFEDDTFQGVFMVFPNDGRFEMMKRDLFRLYETKAPFLLLVQKDMKYDPLKPYEQVSISIDKRTAWDKVIKMPFKFKGLS